MTTYQENRENLPLTTWHEAKVVNFKTNEEKYFSIASSKRNNTCGKSRVYQDSQPHPGRKTPFNFFRLE